MKDEIKIKCKQFQLPRTVVKSTSCAEMRPNEPCGGLNSITFSERALAE